MAPKRERPAASGAANPVSAAIETEEAELQHMASRWARFRDTYAVRASGWIVRTGHPRPHKPSQRAWASYLKLSHKCDLCQQWLFTPFLVPIGLMPTEPLAGGGPDTGLFQCEHNGRQMEHYTNIHRIQYLATVHPAVRAVTLHKIEKANGPSTFNQHMRATKFHQHPYDLKLTLAASGAEIIVGCSVNGAKHDLLSLWWTPSIAMRNKPDLVKLGEAIFFDIIESEHLRVGEAVDAATAALAGGSTASGVQIQPPAPAPPPQPPAPAPAPPQPAPVPPQPAPAPPQPAPAPPQRAAPAPQPPAPQPAATSASANEPGAEFVEVAAGAPEAACATAAGAAGAAAAEHHSVWRPCTCGTAAARCGRAGTCATADARCGRGRCRRY